MVSLLVQNSPIKTLAFISLFFLSLMGMTTAQASERAENAWQALANGATLIDVRTPQEFTAEHLDDALNMPLSELSEQAKTLDRNAIIVVYCRSGNRASHAKRQLHEMGFDEVYNGGGLVEMKASQP